MGDDICVESAAGAFEIALPRRKKKNKKRNRKWSSDLDAVEIGPFLFIPLTCTNALRDEGRTMEHCAKTYEDLCRLNWSRIFSVRDALSQKRIATLSLIWEDDYWHLDQIKGPRNAEVLCDQHNHFNGEETVAELVLTDLYYAAMELVQQYRVAWLNNQNDE